MRGAIAFFSALLAGFFLVAFVASGLITIMTTAAGAAVGTWSTEGTWEIRGNSDGLSCAAINHYANGISMGVMFYEEGAYLIFEGVSVVPGKTYHVIATSTISDAGIMTFTAGNESMIMTQINKYALSALVNQPSIAVQDIGHFDLKGSKKALRSAWECYEALNSY